MNALMKEIPPEDRLITIEDTPELRRQVPNMLRLVTNADKGITATMLLQQSLRMAPDRIWIGELRSRQATTAYAFRLSPWTYAYASPTRTVIGRV